MTPPRDGDAAAAEAEAEAERCLQIVHAIPGRLRLRCSWLRRDRDGARALAEQLADRAGVIEVRARPYTGGLVIRFDPETIDEGQLVEAASRLGGARRVLARGEAMPEPEGDAPAFSHLARQTARLVREIDRDVRKLTRGKSDLGTFMTLAFFTAGAIKAFREKELQLPPWFNLAWWGFRTFTTLERDEIDHAFD